MALIDHWPLVGLRVRTPRLELRYPDEAIDVALAELAARGVHDPASMPFSVPWTDAPADELPRNALQHYWLRRSAHRVEDWSLPLATVVDGVVVGTQDLLAKDFGALRTVLTGSWLGVAHQGQGIGTEMRQAALHLAFAGLGAEVAETAAWHDNAASLRVTRRLGYEPNGEARELRRGVADRMLRYRMTRADWEQRLRRDDIVIEGLEACLPLLVPAAPADPA